MLRLISLGGVTSNNRLWSPYAYSLTRENIEFALERLTQLEMSLLHAQARN